MGWLKSHITFSIVTVTVTIYMLFIFFINFYCCIVASISSASAGTMLLIQAMGCMFMLLFGFAEVVLARSLHFSNRLMLIKCFCFVNISISKPQNRM